MLTKVFQRNLTPWGYVKPPIKPHRNPPWGKSRFRVKSKMAAIKPVIYVIFFLNRSLLRTKHRRATYNMFFRTTFLRDSICSHFIFIRGQLSSQTRSRSNN